MKIRYKRSGGFANITTSLDIDSRNLPAKKASEIHALVQKARVFEQPPSLNREESVADDLKHELEIDDGSRSHRIVRSDSQSSPELVQLFDRLQQEVLANRTQSRA